METENTLIKVEMLCVVTRTDRVDVITLKPSLVLFFPDHIILFFCTKVVWAQP